MEVPGEAGERPDVITSNSLITAAQMRELQAYFGARDQEEAERNDLQLDDRGLQDRSTTWERLPVLESLQLESEVVRPPQSVLSVPQAQ